MYELLKEVNDTYSGLTRCVVLSKMYDEGDISMTVARINKRDTVITRISAHRYYPDESAKVDGKSEIVLSSDEMNNLLLAFTELKKDIAEHTLKLDDKVVRIIRLARSVLTVYSNDRNYESGDAPTQWSIDRKMMYGDAVYDVKTGVIFHYNYQSILDGTYLNLVSKVSSVLLTRGLIDDERAEKIKQQAKDIIEEGEEIKEEDKEEDRDPFLDYPED